MGDALTRTLFRSRINKNQNPQIPQQQPKKISSTMNLLLILILSATRICGAMAFTPKDHYLLHCGLSSNSAIGFDGRVWTHDENSTFSSRSSFTSTVTALANQDLGLGSPFTTARIFNSSFTYTFPVSPGPKFLRLFFYPTLYSQYDASQFFISVQANGHLLLQNFSAQLAVDYAPSTRLNTTDQYVIKEYYIPICSGESSLNLTFSLTPQSSHGFINGIELVSVPDSLYISDTPPTDVDSLNFEFQIPNTSALETAYRLNVGGSDVSDGEVLGMYRHWKADDPYISITPGYPGQTILPINYTEKVPNYTAPQIVYQTYKQLGYGHEENRKLNLTWRFKVDPNFTYLVRLHWCEVDVRVGPMADRIFDVYIDNSTAESSVDVLVMTHMVSFVPIYRDYVVYAGGDGTGGSLDLWIALHPSTKSAYNEVLLNGLEIFKINRADGSLDSPNPQVHLTRDSAQVGTTISPKRSYLTTIIGGTVAGVLLITLLACFLVFRRYLNGSNELNQQVNLTQAAASQQCRRFSLAEIKLATDDFSEDLIVGHGGFGNVYKGTVEGEINGTSTLAVAIKRLKVSSKQGVNEFATEIDLLSKFGHAHLVSLIGFCDENEEMILVYEYMERGTLRDHLYNNINTTDKSPLSWNQRLNACKGAAKGLDCLHTQMIIHRDVKSTNILLDGKWVSRVSDFGLSKMGPIGEGDLSHVSTVVKGSIGYLDLEYYKTRRLTHKSDVYSLGVVLFEVLCGRPAVDVNLPKEQVKLAKWARGCQRKGTLHLIVDPNIKDEIASASLSKFGEIAERCVNNHGSDRPSMADVVSSLEFALDLQEKDAQGILNSNSMWKCRVCRQG